MPTIRTTPLTASFLLATVWGVVCWVAWPSDRLRPAVLVAVVVWAFIFTIRTLRG